MFAVGGESQAGPDILGGEIREVGQDLLGCHPACEVFQDVAYRHPQSADAGLTAAFVWLDSNDFQIVHNEIATPNTPPVNLSDVMPREIE